MKSFRDYLAETAYAAENPVAGDTFAINIREEQLVETYVIAEDADSVTLFADDQMMAILENYGLLGEKMIDIDGTEMNQYDYDTEEEVGEAQAKLDEFLPALGAVAGGIARGAAALGGAALRGGATSAGRLAGGMAAGAGINALSSDDDDDVKEAEYQGREVPLGKPMAGDVKKSKVYVKNAKGNVVKVNFGDPNMKIKKSNPKRRKSFRARHNCANPGPRTSARYWSCRAW
jgi:hypothetical protein